MKKILLSMAVMAAAMTASAADSFTLVNLHDNAPIENGSTITVYGLDEFGMAEFEYLATPNAYPADLEIKMETVELGDIDGVEPSAELCWASGMLGNCLPDATVFNKISVDGNPLKGQIHYFSPNEEATDKIISKFKCFVKLSGKDDSEVSFNLVFDSVNTGIAGTMVDENAPVEYYTIDGVRVANPENGLYIVKQGSKVRKVMMK